MKWELDALRALAKNPTVPGVALQDAIGEIDRLNKVIQKQKESAPASGNHYRVLRITNNVKDYPDCKENTLEFPDLVDDVEDEMDIFIYCVETEDSWKASDFFYAVDEDIKKFVVEG